MADWDAVFSSLFGPAIAAAKATYASPPQPPTAALPAASYVGSYGNDYVGEATVTADGETLTVRLGPDGVTAWPLTHFDRDIFLYHDDAGDAGHAVGRPLRRRPGRPRHRADPRVARTRTASGR